MSVQRAYVAQRCHDRLLLAETNAKQLGYMSKDLVSWAIDSTKTQIVGHSKTK